MQQELTNQGGNYLAQGADYYNDKSAFSTSMFKRLRDNEKEFDKWFKGNTPDPANNAFAVGQYLHAYMAKRINPSYEDENKFVFMPKLDMRTKEAKEFMKKLSETVNLDECYTITEQEKALIERLCDDFLGSEEFQLLLNTADSYDVEEGYKREMNGMMLKGKLDFRATMPDGTRFILDWKSSKSYNDFATKVKYYDYDEQGALYSYIGQADRFAFVVFDVIGFDRWKIVRLEMDGYTHRRGVEKIERDIELAKNYLKHGVEYKGFRQEVLL